VGPAESGRREAVRYGTYLKQTFDRWAGERFVRGHLLIGDGADNGVLTSAPGEATRWGRRGVPITTFVVGDQNTNPDAKDLQVTG